MIHSLFSIPIFQVNLLDKINNDNLLENLYPEFDIKYQMQAAERLGCEIEDVSGLEKQGGISTYSTKSDLHLQDFAKPLVQEVIDQCNLYWRILDLHSGLKPVIHECWTNIHKQNSFTSQHSHSLMPIVATYYAKAQDGCGPLIMTNPAEYSITHLPYNSPIETKTETCIKVKTGDLILFPGYIRHKTGENKSGHDRVVMSFNIKFENAHQDYLSTQYPEISQKNSEVQDLQNIILQQEMLIAELKRNM